MSVSDKLKQQTKDQQDRLAKISYEIRKAVRNALPAPAEQFFTVQVPGKVVNFNDFLDGIDENGYPRTTIKPLSVQLNEAMLCDDMPALAAVQLGPTGRSVSRSYAMTLNKLIPSGTTVGIDEGGTGGASDEEKRYKKAMAFLTSEAPNSDGKKTMIDVYVEKQAVYTKAVEAKIAAFSAALDAANNDPANKTIADKRQAYDKWVSVNARTYRNFTNAAYMDWVVNGNKEQVEYWFAVVDIDTAMARVEASKEAIRNATVSDVDGTTEYNTVTLSPSNWAWLAQQKAIGGTDGSKTVEWYTWEISRLQKQNRLLEALKKAPPKFGGDRGVVVPDKDAGNPEVEKVVAEFIDARAKYQEAALDKTAGAVERLKTASGALSQKRGDLTKAFATYDKDNIGRLTIQGQDEQNKLYTEITSGADQTIAANNTTIKEYDDARQTLLKARLGNPVDVIGADIGLEKPAPEPSTGTPSPQLLPDGRPVIKQADFWTTIHVEVSSSYTAEEMSSSSNSYSAGGGFSCGLFSVGANVSHSDQTNNASSQMSNSSVKATFDCMRVDVTRSWLRPELFYDDDLKPAPGDLISPGPMKLATLMDPDSYDTPVFGDKGARETELAKYALFPMFPTAFYLAANLVLEIEGDTSDVQSHFHSSATSASASVGWGPFAVSASASHSDMQASAKCETTQSGCRISFKAPQIIGWASQMVPALPRIPK